MRQAYFFAGLLALGIPAVEAVDLNKEALKSMQKEGHDIVAQAQGGKAYKTSNGLCLDAANGGLVVKSCKDKAQNQKWAFDDKGRLLAANGKCVDGARLKKCGGAASQKWSLNGKKQLANGKKQCLQTQGNPAKAGAKVVTTACSQAPNQKWM